MTRGLPLTDWQTETIRAVWLLTENGSEAARAAGCSSSAANKYIREHLDELRMERQQKRPELVDVLTVLLERLVSVSFDPLKIQQATLADTLRGIGILTDKIQLISGNATVRTESVAVDPGRLTPEEREQAAKIRAKLAGEAIV